MRRPAKLPAAKWWGGGAPRRRGSPRSTGLDDFSVVSTDTVSEGGTRAHLAASLQLFSFRGREHIANRLAIRSASKPWAPPVSIDTVGTEGEITVTTLDGPAQLGMTIALGT